MGISFKQQRYQLGPTEDGVLGDESYQLPQRIKLFTFDGVNSADAVNQSLEYIRGIRENQDATTILELGDVVEGENLKDKYSNALKMLASVDAGDFDEYRLPLISDSDSAFEAKSFTEALKSLTKEERGQLDAKNIIFCDEGDALSSAAVSMQTAYDAQIKFDKDQTDIVVSGLLQEIGDDSPVIPEGYNVDKLFNISSDQSQNVFLSNLKSLVDAVSAKNHEDHMILTDSVAENYLLSEEQVGFFNQAIEDARSNPEQNNYLKFSNFVTKCGAKCGDGDTLEGCQDAVRACEEKFKTEFMAKAQDVSAKNVAAQPQDSTSVATAAGGAAIGAGVMAGADTAKAQPGNSRSDGAAISEAEFHAGHSDVGRVKDDSQTLTANDALVGATAIGLIFVPVIGPLLAGGLAFLHLSKKSLSMRSQDNKDRIKELERQLEAEKSKQFDARLKEEGNVQENPDQPNQFLQQGAFGATQKASDAVVQSATDELAEAGQGLNNAKQDLQIRDTVKKAANQVKERGAGAQESVGAASAESKENAAVVAENQASVAETDRAALRDVVNAASGARSSEVASSTKAPGTVVSTSRESTWQLANVGTNRNVDSAVANRDR